MQFRGKINSLDIDYNIPMVDMSVTVGNKNFDVSFEVLWGDADEFDGWEQLEKIVDQNRYDREGAVMADINAGRRELSVKYDGGEAYAYGDEAQVDVETENIPGGSRKDPKYINEAGQFDFKKFVADGALEKNLNEIGMFHDPIGYDSRAASEDKRAIAKIKDLIAKGTPRKEAIEKVAKEFELRYHYLEKRIPKEIEEQGPRPKRKHRKNPTRYGRGSHGKIPHFDDAIDAAEPSFPYGVDDPEETSNNASKARKAAKAMGLGPELEKAEYEMHFGRGGDGDRSGEQDPFRWKKSNKRVTKGGKLHKQDLKVAKQDSKRSLDILRKNKAFKKQQGDFLPEFTLEDIDEMLKEARSKDNK